MQNCKSWKIRSYVKKGDVFMAEGVSKCYDGYDMVRVHGGGAVLEDFFEEYIPTGLDHLVVIEIAKRQPRMPRRRHDDDLHRA